MTEKQQALAEIQPLAAAHQITLEEIASALGRQQIDANKKNPLTLTRFFSYLGAIFIFSGVCVYTALVWDSLNTFA